MSLSVALQNLRTGDWSWFEFPTNITLVEKKLNCAPDDEIIVVDSEVVVIPEYTNLREIQQFAEKLAEIPDCFMECLEDWLSIYGDIRGFISEFNLRDWTIVVASDDYDFGMKLVYDLKTITIPTGTYYFDFKAYALEFSWRAKHFFITENFYVFQ